MGVVPSAIPALVFQPILPVGWLIAVGVVLVGFAGWRVVAERHGRALMFAWIRRAVIVLLLLVVAARPSLPGGTAQASVADLNVFFVVDTTSSIVAEDYDGDKPRLDGVRADIDALTDDLAGARFSLISFDNSAVQRVPLTEDSAAVVTSAKVMRQEITYYSTGSTISEANGLLADRLAAARKSDPSRANIVYYFGDGEQTLDEAPGSFASSAANVDGGGVLGYGTSTGGRMLVFDGYGDQYSKKAYIQDRTRSGSPDAVSRIDEGNLRTIAAQLGVPYLHRSAPGGLGPVVDAERHGQVVSASGRTASLIDLYWIAAIPFFALLLVDVALVVRALGEVRPPRRPRPPRQPGRTVRSRLDAPTRGGSA